MEKKVEMKDVVKELENLTNKIKEKETMTKEDIQIFQENLFAVVRMLENIGYERDAKLYTTLLYPVARAIKPVQSIFLGEFGFHLFTEEEKVYRELEKWLRNEKRRLMTVKSEGAIDNEQEQELREIKRIMGKYAG